MKHSILALIIYAACIALIIWGAVDYFQPGKEWYMDGFAFWRIFGGLIILAVTYFSSVRSWKNKGLK